MSTPVIDFVKVLRDCNINHQIASGERKRSPIYDYNVIIDGEHRAILTYISGSGYNLDMAVDPFYAPVRIDRINRVRISSKGVFKYEIARLLEEGKIPSLAECRQFIRERTIERNIKDAEERNLARDTETTQRLDEAHDQIASFGPIGLKVRLWQCRKKPMLFAVTYHQQITTGLAKPEAMREFLSAVEHSIESKGSIRP